MPPLDDDADVQGAAEAYLSLLDSEEEEREELDEDAQSDDGEEEPEKQPPEDEEEEEEEAPAPEKPASAAPAAPGKLHTVKVQGEDVQVSYEELVRGYSREADYTRKTQAVSQKDKDLEAERDQLRAERQQYKVLLPRLIEAVKASEETTEPDWAKLKEEDPVEYAIQLAEWSRGREKREEKIRLAAQERARVEQQEVEDFRKAQGRVLEKEEALLLTVFPAWKDPKVAEAEKAKLSDFALEIGFSASDLEHVTDHRLVRLLHLARKGAEIEKRVSALRPKKASAKDLEPGSRVAGAESGGRRGSYKKHVANLKKTGSVEDAAKAFESLL